MGRHFSRDGNLTEEECFEVHSVEVAEVANRIDMDILELYLINQLSPKLNTASVYEEKTTFVLSYDLKWEPYLSREDILALLKLRKTKDERILMEDHWIIPASREFILFDDESLLIDRYLNFTEVNNLLLTPSQKSVLAFLLDNSKNVLGVSSIGKEYIARDLGISRKTVIRACNRLEDLGIIGQQILQRPTGGNSVCAIYFIPDNHKDTPSVG